MWCFYRLRYFKNKGLWKFQLLVKGVFSHGNKLNFVWKNIYFACSHVSVILCPFKAEGGGFVSISSLPHEMQTILQHPAREFSLQWQDPISESQSLGSWDLFSILEMFSQGLGVLKIVSHTKATQLPSDSPAFWPRSPDSGWLFYTKWQSVVISEMVHS